MRIARIAPGGVELHAPAHCSSPSTTPRVFVGSGGRALSAGAPLLSTHTPKSPDCGAEIRARARVPQRAGARGVQASSGIRPIRPFIRSDPHEAVAVRPWGEKPRRRSVRRYEPTFRHAPRIPSHIPRPAHHTHASRPRLLAPIPSPPPDASPDVPASFRAHRCAPLPALRPCLHR